MALTRIVIATPSVIEHSRLSRLLAEHSDLEILTSVHDLSATYSQVEQTMPDIVLIDSSFTTKPEYSCMVSLFSAVETTPILIDGRSASQGQNPQPAGAAATISARMSSQEIYDILAKASAKKSKPLPRSRPVVLRETLPIVSDKILMIGASTGGIDALTTILASFPENCPPTAIVQHTGRNFSETLVKLLNKRCAAEVVRAKTGVVMQAGRICVAGGIDGHLTFETGRQLKCLVKDSPEVSGHRPSIDEMFTAALPFASRVIAVLLTGMGRDGAMGLRALRRAGAQTIGQDEESSVVYGMPRVAFELGAVQTQLALDKIGPELMARCRASAHSFSNSRSI